jgi:hypothetical protein
MRGGPGTWSCLRGVSKELSGVLLGSFFSDIREGKYSNAMSLLIYDRKSADLFLFKELTALHKVGFRGDCYRGG